MMPQSVVWENRRHDDRIAENADQSEFNALAYGKSNIEAGTFDDRIADALDDYEVSDPMDTTRWAKADFVLDNAVSDLASELARRASKLGGSYPFLFNGNQLVYRGTPTLVYELCLAISQAQSLSSGEFRKLPIAFERMMKDIVVRFFGPDTTGFRTGWPPDSDRATRFRELASEINARTNEWIWSPDFGLPDDPSHQDVKDEGLDFVAWKDFGDGRLGKLFVLGQCACGNDYPTKFQDLDSEFAKLSKWIKPLAFAKPYRVFCTPRHIPNDIYFGQVNKEAGLTFDRIRIALLAEKTKDCFEQCKDNFVQLIRIVVSGFQVA